MAGEQSVGLSGCAGGIRSSVNDLRNALAMHHGDFTLFAENAPSEQVNTHPEIGYDVAPPQALFKSTEQNNEGPKEKGQLEAFPNF